MKSIKLLMAATVISGASFVGTANAATLGTIVCDYDEVAVHVSASWGDWANGVYVYGSGVNTSGVVVSLPPQRVSPTTSTYIFKSDTPLQKANIGLTDNVNNEVEVFCN